MFSNFSRSVNPAFLQYLDVEWRMKNRRLYDLADGDCSKSESITSESRRLCRDLQDKTDKKSRDVNRQFDLRIGDVEFWRKELDREVACLIRTNDLLTRLVTRLKNAAYGCEDPIKTCKAILILRDSRKGIDLVDDEPQKQVQKYLSLSCDTLALLNRTIVEAEEQIRANQQIIHQIQKDITDKFETICIDFRSKALCLNDDAPPVFKFNDELLRPPKGSVTLADWESWTIHNVEKAEYERSCSDKLRPKIEQILRQTYEDLELQRQKVLDAFKDRLEELKNAQKNLDERVGNIEEQIIDTKQTLEKLSRARDEKFQLLERAQKRMIQRRTRPRMELVRDYVDSELNNEVGLLTRAVDELNNQLQETQKILEQLRGDKLSLSKEVEIKKDTIFMDENNVNSVKNLPHQLY